jgi:hypothetical protein
VDEDEKDSSYILHSQVEKVTKDTRNMKFTGDDNVSANVFKLLADGSFKIITQLINNIYETGE